MSSRKADALFCLLFLGPAAIALGQVLSPQASFYTAEPSPTLAAWVAALSKLLLLSLAALYSHRSARGLATAHDRVASAWERLALAWLLYFLGQLCLAWYQLVQATDAPFPSIADAFFLAAYPFFFSSLVGFLRGYRDAGFATDTAAAQRRCPCCDRWRRRPRGRPRPPSTWPTRCWIWPWWCPSSSSCA